MRAVFLQGLEHAVSMTPPPVQAEFERLRAKFPTVAPYSFAPLPQVMLMHVHTTTLFYPGHDIVQASNTLARLMISSNKRLPNIQSLVGMCDGDPGAYFAMLSEGTLEHLVENFGHRVVVEREPRRILCRHEEMYSNMSEYYVPGAYAGSVAWFDHKANVTFERVDDHTFIIDATW